MNKFLGAFISDFLGLFLRHAISLVGGSMITYGLADQATVDSWMSNSMAISTGLIAVLSALILSYINKKE